MDMPPYGKGESASHLTLSHLLQSTLETTVIKGWNGCYKQFPLFQHWFLPIMFEKALYTTCGNVASATALKLDISKWYMRDQSYIYLETFLDIPNAH